MEATPDVDAIANADAEVEPFSTLRRLGLGCAELKVLRRKGYLTQDDRGHGHGGYWRLRFRRDGRARAVYLGRDEALVEQVRRELDELQHEHQENRQIAKLTVQGNKALRAAKLRLEPVLQQLGFHYHGDVVRRKRGDKKVER